MKVKTRGGLISLQMINNIVRNDLNKTKAKIGLKKNLKVQKF
jgi:hypothetical protein